MAAPLDEPGSGPSCSPHEPGRRFTSGRAVRRPPRGPRVEGRPTAGLRVLRRTAIEDVLDFGAEPHDLELGDNPEWTRPRCACLSVADDATVGVGRRPVTGERTLRKQTPTPWVDLDATSRADVGDGADGHGGPGRRRPSPRHPARRHGAERRLRLRRLRGVDAAVVHGRRPVSARPRRRVRARPSRGGGSSVGVVPRRQAAQQAQHVHRHGCRRRSRRAEGLRRPARARHPWRQRRRSPRRRLHHDAAGPSPPPSPKCPSSTSSRR